MKITLAGYNLDAEVIAELAKGQDRQDLTPETLSASYARISRDPRPINELRDIARTEVEKARRSNSNIIFKMGHHSVAEHAVFNFDLIDVSRLAMEYIEKFRLCSFTEKSQRYQKLGGGFIVPDEIRGTKLEPKYLEAINRQNEYYQNLVGKGTEPEDARYVTPLATFGQLGMTLNARNLELMIRRFASADLAEVREIGQKVFELASAIAPSIVLFTSANDLDKNTYQEIAGLVSGQISRKRKIGPQCQLVDHTENADLKTVASLLHTVSRLPYKNCLRTVKQMSKRAREETIKKASQYLEFYDAVLREFEHVCLTFDLVMSSSCFAQMKRHRMATITSQAYDPALGVTIPPKIRESGAEKDFYEIIKITEAVFSEIFATQPAAAPYLLTGAHRKRALLTVNARELYHLSRLREDSHAQWDIQELTREMTGLAKKVMPLTMMLIGGKDVYPDIYQSIYQRPPKILPPKE